jgi:hypothetical protein
MKGVPKVSAWAFSAILYLGGCPGPQQGKFTPERIRQAVHELGGNPNVSSAAYQYLYRAGKKAVPELLAVVDSNDLDQAYFAIHILDWIGDQSVVPSLFRVSERVRGVEINARNWAPKGAIGNGLAAREVIVHILEPKTREWDRALGEVSPDSPYFAITIEYHRRINERYEVLRKRLVREGPRPSTTAGSRQGCALGRTLSLD